MKKVHVIVIVLITAVLFFGINSGGALAGEKVVKWRMGNFMPRLPMVEKIFHSYATYVKEASGGRFIIDDIYDGEGVSGDQAYSAVKSGLIEMATVYLPLHAGEFPAGVVQTGLPGLTINLMEMQMLYDFGWKDILSKAYAKQGIHWLADQTTPPTYILTKKPIKSIEDFKGMKLRAVGANAKFVRQLGASPVSVPFGEIYTGLATGVFDGIAGTPLVDMSDGKFYELAKFITPQQITFGINTAFIINMKEWKKLPSDLQKILELAATKTAFDQQVVYNLESITLMDKMMKAGLKWGPELSESDKKDWVQAGRKVWDEYKNEKYSKELIKVQDNFLEELKKISR
jgi:TRAP-type C4-dicarboxylate transport system substrate-binding protein